MDTHRPRLGVISDETGDSLNDCIAFAVDEGLDHVEIRMVDGKAPLSLSEAEAGDANRRIRDAGLAVLGIATPLLKWEAPGKKVADLGDQFGFERDGRSDDELAMLAIRIADCFETRQLRIFSYLTHDGFVIDDLRPALDRLLELAERHDKVLLVENEPVCNVGRIDELLALMKAYDAPRLRALPDIGNSAQIGEFPTAELIAELMPYTGHVHFKDWSKAAEKFVPLGEGDVRLDDYVATLSRFANESPMPLTFSLETHMPDDRMGGTRASARQLRAVTARHFR